MTGQAKDVLIVQSKKMPGCLEAYFVGGGELPKEINGKYWTNRMEAEKDINKYLSNRRGAEKRATARAKSRTE